MRYLKGILLPALLALVPLAAGKDQPIVKDTKFSSNLVNLLYFEDSEVALAAEWETGYIHRTENAGAEWEKLDFKALEVLKNPYDNNVAIAIGETDHHITFDRGKSWDKFHTKLTPSWTGMPISYHATDNKKIMYHTMENAMGIGFTFYTEDGFKTEPKLLRDDRRMCIWAKGTDRFLHDSDKSKEYDSRVLCITTGKYSDRSKDFRLLLSDKYFDKGDEHEPVMSSGRTVAGMANMATVQGYIVVAAKSDHSKELALYVTDDTDTWHQALFGENKIEQDAYTILESTNYSIQVDVQTDPRALMGSLFTSNSNGTYFTKNVDNTNRNKQGFVDFEKIANIQGIVLVNLVDNAEDYLKGRPKELCSKISFDDGRTFQDLIVKDGDRKLHLHSMTNQHNSGRVFSSPAPGIVMGVGNTGKHLGDYKDGDLYVSDDAGRTWQLALEGAHKYEFGNSGSVLVAVEDETETDIIKYSLKHGRGDWKEIKLDYKIRAGELTTTPDSTSLKFILYGATGKKGGGREYVVIHLDFAGLHEGPCKKDDFEEWAARTDDDHKSSCIMGQKQYFSRRKWDADCFVEEDFKEPLATLEPCDCDEVLDYECDFNFIPHGSGKDKECKPSPALEPPKGACEGDAKTYKGPSGWRKIPGNKCKGKTKKEDEVERKCDEVSTPTPSDDKITVAKQVFKGAQFKEWYYLERPAHGKDDDETVVVLTSENEAWITHDHGKKWKKAVDDDIVAIYPHQYNNDYVYFLTGTEKVYYSENRGLRDTIHNFDAPRMPNTQMLQIIQFHPTKSDWLIWVGGEHCKRPNDPECHTIASVSQKNGIEWNTLLAYVKKCGWVYREGGKVADEKLVFCEQYTNEEMGAPVELITSTDWFANKEIKFKSVVEYATMSEFIIVATKGEDGKSLKLDASLDGQTFADAKFPPKFDVDHQTAYTVLDSSTHSVFLHVTVNPRPDQEYGAIIKSNSNGTSYVMSLNNVNRNTQGYVDFEKMQGIEGVALANVVSNVEAVNTGAKKEKKTLITHNDGADWSPLQAPAVDSENKPYDCDVSKEDECSLHLHGYTERGDPRETFSSPTAVGIMLGVGNVGKSLSTFGESSTFITTDAGVTWKEAKKGNYAWEFGDQGSVIVLVHRGKDTKDLYYSLDSGEKWQLYEFANHALQVDAISTVPSDTSLNFILWGRDARELVAINVDFSQLKEFEKKCALDEENPEGGDYTLWTPQHPMQDDEDKECLFGHAAQYHRKKRDAHCKNEEIITHLHNIARNCTCTRRDFECDFNYERMPGGECKPVSGLSLPDPKEVCKQKGVKEYWDITGYRKIPISTCEGGKEMDHTSSVHPCPGFEEEFEKKHGISGFGIFLAVVLPFVAAGGIGYYIWRNWDGKFGRIRLGDSYDAENPWVRWPVAIVSGLVAVVAAIPLVVGSLWRMVSERFGRGGGAGYGPARYTSRSSFARGRGSYAVVDEDEGELLGEESDEEV